MTNPLDGNGVALEPCPFCGCDDIGTEKTVTDGSVWCRGCRAKILVRHAHPRLDSGQADAIATWNRRAPLASPQTAVEPVALAQALKNLAEGAEREDREILYAAAYALTEQTAAREAAEKERDQLIAAVKLMEYSDGDALHWRALCDHAVARAEAAEARALTAHDDAIRKAAEVAREAIKVSVVLVPRGPFMSGELPSPKELEKQVKAAILALLSDSPKTGDDNV